MANWTDAKLRLLLSSQPTYFTISLKGRVIGFLRITEAIDRPFDGQMGLTVVRWACLALPGQPRQLIHEELFCTADRRVERWRHALMTGSGRSASRAFQEGIKQGDLLLVGSSGQGRAPLSKKHLIPPTIREAYMPGAMSAIAPQLIDRSKAQSYGFAVYNPVAGGFDLRRIRIVGPETLRVGPKAVPAVRLTDQKADDAPVTEAWVDVAGRLLQTRAPGGLLVQRATPGTVTSLFAAELNELKKLASKVKRPR